MSEIRAALDRLTGPGGKFEVRAEEATGERVFRQRPHHLADIATRASAHEGDFLVGPRQRYGFAETVERARAVAGALIERGLGPGDRLVVLGANAPDWVVAYWAGVIADAVVVPMNAWWRSDELAAGIDDCTPTWVIADGARGPLAAKAGFDPERIVTWSGDGFESLDSLVEAAAASVPGDGERRGEHEVAVLFYTSGTTSRPKGVPLSHRNVIAGFLNAVAMAAAAREVSGEDGRRQQVDLCVIPLFHATANLAIMVPFAAAGHTLVFLPPGRFDPEVAAGVMARERVTRFGGVPTIVNRMLESRAWEHHDLSSVVRVSYGGAPASPRLPARIAEAFPAARGRVVQGYGLTETTAITTLNQGGDYERKPASVGIAAPTVELRVAGVDGSPLPSGTEGEIQVRGSNVFGGYWNHPEADAFAGGFFRTGDIGYLDDEGFLYVTDRAKDVIVRGGENISSAEVEAVLEDHPAVVEAGVVGVADPDLGEVVKAVVVVTGEMPDIEELQRFAQERLATFKVPVKWELISEPLPRNPAGKVLKAELRGSARAVFADEGDSAL